MSRLDEQLSAEFHRWEKRGRGWQVFPEPVAPEPPFVPFHGHFLPTAPAIDDGAKPTFFPDKIRKLNELCDAAFKDDAKVTFCDTWALFDTGDGQCKKDEFPDMLHPNAAGYAKWTAALAPIFQKLGVAK